MLWGTHASGEIFAGPPVAGQSKKHDAGPVTGIRWSSGVVGEEFDRCMRPSTLYLIASDALRSLDFAVEVR